MAKLISRMKVCTKKLLHKTTLDKIAVRDLILNIIVSINMSLNPNC